MTSTSSRWCLLALLLVACDGPTEPMADGGGADAGSSARCAAGSDCDDGVYCNGAERCAPADPPAGGDGCVAGDEPCLAEGLVCSESQRRCMDACPDADGDGHPELSCGGDDCDDADAARFPGNPEVCDAEGHDEDCDPETLGSDGDGDGLVSTGCCNLQPGGSSLCGLDCDDDNREINPGAAEVCNGVDEDCDEQIDEGVRITYYRDADGDGAGDPDELLATRACSQPAGYSERATDCDDSDPMRRIGLAEVCDGRDNDCDGLLDAPGEDDDGDGFADACAGLPPERTDCDDEVATTHPGAPELCNGVDDDCSGAPIDGDDLDGDGQVATDSACSGGVLSRTDCDDTVATTLLGAPELCNGVDDDCDDAIDGADAFCGLDHASSTCESGGACAIAACDDGYLDCDDSADSGCEIDGLTDVAHCGSCDNACTDAEYCRAGACAEYAQWATAPGGQLSVIALDGAGGAAIGGELRDPELTLGTTTLTNVGPCDPTCPEDILVIALGPGGEPRWARSFGGTSGDGARAIAVDPAGDVVVAGSFYSGDLEIVPGDPLLSSWGQADIFVAKLAAVDGAPAWAVAFGGTRADRLLAVEVDGAGDIFVAGAFESPTLPLGGRTLTASDLYDLFVAKLDGSDGSVVWAKAIGTAGNDSFGGLAVTPGGDALIGGAFEGETLTVGSETLTGTECNIVVGETRYCMDDVFVARLAGTDGNTVWARTYPGEREEWLAALATDPTGGAILTGRMYGTVGGETFADEHFVARIADADGAVSWARALDRSSGYYVRGVGADPAGRAWATGFFDGASFSAAGRTFASAGGRDVFLVRLSADGSDDWAATFGGPGGDEGAALGLDDMGRAALLGSSSSSTLDVGTFTVPGSADSIDPAGFAASIVVE